MKNALISPNEIVEGRYQRIAEVCENTFEVAPPLYWIECNDDVIADWFAYDPETNQCVQVIFPPPPEPELASNEQIKNT